MMILCCFYHFWIDSFDKSYTMWMQREKTYIFTMKAFVLLACLHYMLYTIHETIIGYFSLSGLKSWTWAAAFKINFCIYFLLGMYFNRIWWIFHTSEAFCFILTLACPQHQLSTSSHQCAPQWISEPIQASTARTTSPLD